ncbi:hypothetical protein CABS01_02174 [Colletotrichum abscissum]|uniref:BTB domain-containing protein n=1 Tax=Colletotrichum abscissum TaxID=1671311 RepID=A0A9P9XJ78_9PEZI|nr:uncharacterized protein CABS01_02174 [Colletotrichum abscissum]KAI3554473.1 hypothetical protein CABS02_05290 [Colletotrichum abscissum]KAK1488544.1 hypothetical protein CABS01_02174 [Colletotrichum abscissum]
MDQDREVLFPIRSGDDGDQVRIVIECANDKSFVVQKSLLTRHSDFFRACLSHDFQESKRSTIRMLDVDADLMFLYLGFAHRQFNKTPEHGGTFGIISIAHFLHVADWTRLVKLYQLLDFLQNKELLSSARSVLSFNILTAHIYLLALEADGAEVDRCFDAFARAFDTLDVDHPVQARFRDEMVARFCEHCHWDLLVRHHHALEPHPEFVAKMSLKQAEYAASMMQYLSESPRARGKISGLWRSKARNWDHLMRQRKSK